MNSSLFPVQAASCFVAVRTALAEVFRSHIPALRTMVAITITAAVLLTTNTLSGSAQSPDTLKIDHQTTASNRDTALSIAEIKNNDTIKFSQNGLVNFDSDPEPTPPSAPTTEPERPSNYPRHLQN